MTVGYAPNNCVLCIESARVMLIILQAFVGKSEKITYGVQLVSARFSDYSLKSS